MTESASAHPGIGDMVAGASSDVPGNTRRVGTRSPTRLKKRADFVRAARGKRAHTGAFTLQAVERGGGATTAAPRIGFTVTRKTGGSVERNRMRRRVKEALRQLEDLPAHPGHDYVLVLRRQALSERFDRLRTQLSRSFAKIHSVAAKAARSAPTGVDVPD